MNKNAQFFIGACLFLMSITLFLATGLYTFTDGADDIAEEITVASVVQDSCQLMQYVPKGTSINDCFIDALKDNELVSDIELKNMDVSVVLSETRHTPYFLSRFESSLDDVCDYIEVIRLTFTYDKKRYVSADIIVWKGKLFFFLGKNIALSMRPWARLLTIYNLKTTH